MAAAPDAPTLKTIANFADSFRLVGPDGETFTVKWKWEPSLPTTRPNGVTGWADHNGKVIRVHVCAHNPCTAVHSPAKYGNFTAPKHGRLLPRLPNTETLLPPPETEPLAEPAPVAPITAPSDDNGVEVSDEHRAAKRRRGAWIDPGDPYNCGMTIEEQDEEILSVLRMA